MIVKKIDPIRRINLHLHTNVSDGFLSPSQVVERARERNLDLISLTDHDTGDAYQHLPQELGNLKILPGMELSSTHEGSDVHILGYGAYFKSPLLAEMIDMYLIGRRERAVRMIEKLGDLGMELSLEEVVAVSGSRELIVRPHIAQVMMAKGYVSSKNEAFDKYIGNDCPAFHPKPEFSVPEALDAIHEAGGFAIIAHPGKLEKEDYIHEFVDMGIDGLEVWHPDHYQYQVKDYIEICQNNGLYMTAGSDFHGDQDRHNVFDAVPANEVILESVNQLWREYQCRVN
ncbi:MAG: PHP domain-containing protein [Candidatus Cloacimonadaceae bacterium]|jgi:predicted metal-dependent phosphoesterase TrpH|nr:PHP domain-containing protein [Candidatus Cloacimonadota bacterium]MDX9949628.1 PHP domain-containing protein [Candidatus Syntrophosphaera sp.]